jgi:hypothetical protein
MPRSAIPPHLPLPPIEAEAFRREAMGRSARLSAPFNMQMGIFALLGRDEAHIAAAHRDLAVLSVMEEVSLSFYLVEQQRLAGEIVSPDNIERLVATLVVYFQRSRRPRSAEAVQSMIDRYLDEHSVPNPLPVGLAHQEVQVDLPLLYQLYSIDEQVQARIIGMHGRPATLDCVGLGLDRHLDSSRYDHCTPLNCRTFAGTGGDGAHFSLLMLDGMITAQSPVVVTDPSSGGPSVIAGESLRDFLCLGCEKGYFPLGHLAGDPPTMIAEYCAPASEPSPSDFVTEEYQIQTLKLLREHLGLQRWTSRERYHDLQSRFAQLLIYPPDAL